MADALKAGEFVNEAPAKAEDTATTEPIKVEAEIVETSTSPLPTETASSGNNNSTFYGCFSRRTSSYGKFGS